MTDSDNPRANRDRRIRFAPAAIIGAVAASATIALSLNGTLAGFVAQITNSQNTAASGTLVMKETNSDGSVACYSNGSSTATDTTNNVATCSTINKYGGSTTMVPGTPVSTTVKITDTGTVKANTFTIAPGACSPSFNGSVHGSATDICAKMTLTVTQDGSTVTGLNAVALSSIANTTLTLAPLAAGTTSTFVFTVNLPSQNTPQAPTADNAYQGLAVSQPLVWQFVS